MPPSADENSGEPECTPRVRPYACRRGVRCRASSGRRPPGSPATSVAAASANEYFARRSHLPRPAFLGVVDSAHHRQQGKRHGTSGSVSATPAKPQQNPGIHARQREAARWAWRARRCAFPPRLLITQRIVGQGSWQSPRTAPRACSAAPHPSRPRRTAPAPNSRILHDGKLQQLDHVGKKPINISAMPANEPNNPACRDQAPHRPAAEGQCRISPAPWWRWPPFPEHQVSRPAAVGSNPAAREFREVPVPGPGAPCRWSTACPNRSWHGRDIVAAGAARQPRSASQV